MRQALKIKCWKCSEVFTSSAEISNVKSGPLVDSVIPCPFCQTSNQVTVHASQVKTATLYRDGEAAETLYLDKPGALLEQVFDGEKTADS
jgi:phage FluMu protein Com